MDNKYTSCTDCTYLYYDNNSNGEGMLRMVCDKRYWDTINLNYEIDFRAAMRKARSCPDFKAVAMWDLETGLVSTTIGKPNLSSIDRQMAEAIKINLDLKRGLKNGHKKKK